MDWYYAEGQQQRGPVSEAEIEGLVKSGTVGSDTLVWREGMANWQAYGQVKGAAPTGAAVPAAPVAGVVVCSQCGRAFAQDEVIRYGELWVCAACKPTFFQRLKEGAQLSSGLEYAGFWIRFGAKFIDGLIMGAAVVLPIMIFAFVVGFRAARAAQGDFALDPAGALPNAASGGVENLMANVVGLLVQLVLVVVHVVYSTFFLGRYGATPGKMACRLKVVDAEGGRIGYGRAFGRSCAEILSRLICLIGYIIAAFDEQKRTLHDHICSTRVVHNR